MEKIIKKYIKKGPNKGKWIGYFTFDLGGLKKNIYLFGDDAVEIMRPISQETYNNGLIFCK